MPIAIVCPGCSAKLNAPDAAAGKKIKCPRCQAVCAVPAPAAPAFEVVEDAEPPKPTPKPTAKPAPKAAVPDDEARPRGRRKTDEEDEHPRNRKRGEDEDDEPPRKRRRDDEAEKAGGSKKLLIGGLVAVLLAGGGFAAYWFGFRDKSGGGGGGQTVSTENWETYTSPGNVFKASFPGTPTGGEWKPPGGPKVHSDIRTHRTGEAKLGKPSMSFFAGYVRFPDAVGAKEVETAQKWIITLHAAPATYGGGANKPTKVQAGGREWEEERFKSGRSTGLVRWHRAGPMLHLVGYRSESQEPAAEAVEQFLASHEVLGGDPGDPDPDPVKLDGWEPYTSANNVFKASFPGATKKREDYFFGTAKAAEFREYVAKDEKSGKSRTYFAGYVRFAKKPTYQEGQEVKNYLQRAALGDTTNTGQSRVTFGGWPWGEERRMELDKAGFGGGNNGIVRWVEAGPVIYAAGIKSSGRFPQAKEIDQFLGAFEILDAKPEPKDLAMPPDWAEYRAPGGEFRTAMPRQVHRQDDPAKTGNQFAGVAIGSLTEYKGYDLHTDLIVYAVKFAPNTAESDRQKVLDVLTQRGQPPAGATKPGATTAVKWGGRDATEHAYTPADVRVARQTHDDAVGYVAIALQKYGKLNPDLARAFLDGFAFGKDVGPETPPKSDKPPGWTSYKPEKVGFRALMPGSKGISGQNLKLTAAQSKAVESVRRSRATEGTHTYTVLVVRFVPGAKEEDRQAAMDSLTAPVVLTPQQAKPGERKKITWGERDALEHTYTPADLCVCRQTHTDAVGYAAAVHVQGGKLDAEKAKLFLDSFEFDKE